MALPALLLAAAVATWTVDPGTQGVLVEDHRAPIVSVRVEFAVGTASPWAKAHHADEAFDWQQNDPDRALKRRADALGVDLSVGMGTRSAFLYGRCLKRDLDAMLALVEDVLSNTRYDERDIKRSERERSIQWRGNETDVQFRLGQAAARMLFEDPEDPRRRPYEKPEALEHRSEALAAARDAVVRAPGRVIGFAGDLTPDEARRAAGGLLPPAEAQPLPDAAPRWGAIVPASRRAKDASIPLRKLTQVYLAYGRDSLPWGDSSRPAYLIADHVLGGHFYSRLYVALRHEGGDTYGAGTVERGDVVPGAYGAATFTRAANAAAIEAKLRETMAAFREKGITEDERAKAVSYLGGRRAFERQAPDQLLDRYLSERRLGLAPGYLDGLVDRASQLSLDEINAFIRDFYDPAQFSMVRAVPK